MHATVFDEKPVDERLVNGLPTAMRIVEMTERHVADMVTWKYPDPYACYDLTGADPAYFLEPANGFFALVDDAERLIGFRSFGPDGRVPGGAYNDTALDTGGGLRPELIGQGRGLGAKAITVGLAFGRDRFRPSTFRVTVADFNTRARHVIESLGFRYSASFNATTGGTSYSIYLLPNSHH